MKEIILIRHAKSDWGNEFLKDVDRHLNERGYSDAYRLGKWYAENKVRPDLILASTGIRALSTGLIFARCMDLEMKNFQLEKTIYEASSDILLSVIKKQDASKNTLMLFGHNPSVTSLCNKFSDDLFFDDIPTCGIVSYRFDVEQWSEVAPKAGKLNYFQFPKDFRNKD